MRERHAVVWTSEQVNRFWDYQVHRPSARDNYFSIGRGAQIAKRTLPLVARTYSARVLDLGCGTGHFLKHLAHIGRGLQLFGIDFSSESIRSAQQTCSSMEPPPDLRVADRYPTSLPDVSIDVVYSIEVVEHLADDALDAMIAEVHRVLKKGGFLVITTPNNEDLERSQTCCPDCNATFHIWQHVRTWSTDSLASFIASHGFSTVVAKSTFLEPLPLRILLRVAVIFGLAVRSPPRILAIFRKS